MNRKTKFAWASIAGADYEPVELVTNNGRKAMYTLGCADPFWLDEKVPEIIIYKGENEYPLRRPDAIQTQVEKDKAEREYAEYRKGHHGWRGPR